jgi:hypothetical protein
MNDEKSKMMASSSKFAARFGKLPVSLPLVQR